MNFQLAEMDKMDYYTDTQLKFQLEKCQLNKVEILSDAVYTSLIHKCKFWSNANIVEVSTQDPEFEFHHLPVLKCVLHHLSHVYKKFFYKAKNYDYIS